MKRLTVILLFLLPTFLYAQQDWNKLRKKSIESFAYRISADSAEKYIKKDSIPVDVFLNYQPSFVFKTDSVDTDLLPKGLYVLLKIVDNKIESEIIGITDLVVYPLINEQIHILELRTKNGAFIANADVWVNGVKTKYNVAANNYLIKQKELPEDPFIKVYTANDTSFLSFEYKEPNQTVSKQKWQFFKRKKIGRIITWLPDKIKNLINGRHYRKYKSSSIGANGYVIFNQPKYKLTDTVKLKAYIVNRKWKPFKETAELYLNYYARGKNYSQLLAKIRPSNAGSFVYEFPLSDTLINDNNYTIEFRTVGNKKRILSKGFKVEDYVLDEVAKYDFRSQKDCYYKGDSLVFYASAKDANNLPLLDAKAKLFVLNKEVNVYEQDSIYVADTLFVQEKNMLSEGETIFTVPALRMPFVTQKIVALLQFKNSNNEIQEKTIDLKYIVDGKELRVKTVEDSVFIDFFEDGQMKEADGDMEIDGKNNIKQTVNVHYPLKIKIDPLAEDYDFYVKEKNKIIASASSDINRYYTVDFSRISINDTAGFVLRNPYKVPVTFLVLDGNKLIASGKSSEEFISWKQKINRRNKLLTLKYNYAWRGKLNDKTENIALLYKIMKIEINSKGKIYPGQQDSVNVRVTDYKGNPVSNVNLTAVAYNSQFKSNINVPEPPYLVRYKQNPIGEGAFMKWNRIMCTLRIIVY
jgi:hypothetical protein